MKRVLPGELQVHCSQPGHVGVAIRRQGKGGSHTAEGLKLRGGEQAILDEHLARRSGVIRRGVVVVRDVGVEIPRVDLAAKAAGVGPRHSSGGAFRLVQQQTTASPLALES